ncbi:hypothetical protein CH275_16695 [Rhodococcus sp. 06-235-1A]|uniref:hypothetical protein n=1 Tax=Rhodococcus sp. 06-235-1A TaxID=2022508 RepID=UPI000B9AB999|nr:hypothetical protein [Rhodococcus sp. 06-235-1A]OZD03409.1 hypothetical protein CH275_16695 [Rhodococcus sp. 06-235-1A]
MKKRSILSVIAVGAVLAAVSACSSVPATENDPAPTTPPTPTYVASSDWGYDIENENMVAGAADTIIVGTVLSQVDPSTSRQEPNPETQFEVDVLSTLKGEPAETITVSQLGGYVAEANTVVMSGDDSLMTVGSSYVMALVFDPAVGWYTASPATNGIEEIPTVEAQQLDPEGAQRRGGQAEPAAVAEMRDAIANQQEPESPAGEPEGELGDGK